MKYTNYIGFASVMLTAIWLGATPVMAAATQSPARDAVESVLKSPGSALPHSAKLRDIAVQNGLATVNFNSAFVTDFKGGDTVEAAGVNSILKALGRFPDVSKVQILVNGEHVDTLGGLLDISGPLPVIRENNTLTARSSTVKSIRVARR